MSKNITKAVVAVAGSGTRFLPATLRIPKEMLPVLDKPTVQLVVEELAASGITDILFVTSQSKKALEDHFDAAPELESALLTAGKHDLLADIKRIRSLARYYYTRQIGPYGNGTPLLCAEAFVGDDPFVFAFGDDLVFSETPFTKHLIDRYRETGNPVIGVDEVPWEEVSKYGVIEMGEKETVKRIIEKPNREDAPSNSVGLGRYVADRRMIEALKATPLGKGNELWLVDAFMGFILSGGVIEAVHIPDGRWHTTGDPVHMIEATLVSALKDERYANQVRNMIKRYQ